MPEFETVFQGDHLRATWFPGTRPQLMVTFDYRRTGRSGFSAANHSSGYARQGFGQLSIQTRVNDWFINPDTGALEQAVGAIAARYDRVHALGYSMGGYGALRLARALRLDKAVLVSPQATIAPEVVPFDLRYRAEGLHFDAALGDLAPRAVPDLAGFLVIDPFVTADRRHAAMILALFPRLRLLRLNFGGHPAIRVLRSCNKAWLVQREAALADPKSRGEAIVRAHRAGRRGSAGYWQRLALRADLRRPALAARARDRAARLVPAAGDAEGDDTGRQTGRDTG